MMDMTLSEPLGETYMQTIEQPFPGEPIVVTTYSEPYPPDKDIVEANHQVKAILEQIDGPIYLINDIRSVEFNFSQVVVSMATAFKDRSSLPPDRIIGIAVGTQSMLKLFVNSAKQFQYGEVSIERFDTVEEAIAFARERLGSPFR